MAKVNMSTDAMVGRIAALEWMVAQLYAMVAAQMTNDPRSFFEENRRQLASRESGWRLPSEISKEAARESFDRVFSIGEDNAVMLRKDGTFGLG